MQTYLAVLMTISGVIGFGIIANAGDEYDYKAGVTALKIASALLAGVVALAVRG
jgi:hypothetical protein